MRADELLATLSTLTRAGVTAYVAGGWAADLLVGGQTREHADLDLAVDRARTTAARDALVRDGFAVTTDWSPARLELRAPDGRTVDLHPVAMQPDGSGLQEALDGTTFTYPPDSWARGTLGGARLPCLSASAQLRFRQGYPLREEDRHDLVLLARALPRGGPEIAADGTRRLVDLGALRPDVTGYQVLVDDRPVGALTLARTGEDARAGCWVDPLARRRGLATWAGRELAVHAFTALGVRRLEARAAADDRAAARTGVLTGFHLDGVLRRLRRAGGTRADVAVLSRLPSDPDPEVDSLPAHASTLPRKRLAAGLLLRDREGRVLLVEPTYKPVWDLPGGTVEADESPRAAVLRETEEELGVRAEAGRLLCLDWLPAEGTRSEGVMMLFDGGVVGPELIDRIRLADDELRSWAWCDASAVPARVSPRLARRVAAALEAARTGSTAYLEEGRPVGLPAARP